MPEKLTCAPVSFRALRDGYDFASMGQDIGNEAYVSKKTGEVVVVSDEVEMDRRPDDLKRPGRYIALPSKSELDLDRDLVFAFVQQAMPEEAGHVAGFFGHSGAYGRFKDLLRHRGKLGAWHDFEERATDEALKRWCASNDIPLC